MRALALQVLRLREQVAEPTGIRAVHRLGAGGTAATVRRIEARGPDPKKTPAEGVGRVVLEEIPPAQDGELEAGQVDVRPQPVFVPLAAHVGKHRKAVPLRRSSELLRRGKRRTVLRVAAVSHVEPHMDCGSSVKS